MKTNKEKIQQAADQLFYTYSSNTPCQPIHDLLEAQDIDAECPFIAGAAFDFSGGRSTY